MYDFLHLKNMFENIKWHENAAASLRYTHGFCYFHPIHSLPPITLQTLYNMQENYAILSANTEQFCAQKKAANALLWGARGCGKSSLIKAIFYTYTQKYTHLRIFELAGKDIAMLPLLFDCMQESKYSFVVFCDDLSFSKDSTLYHDVKSVLDGSLEQQAENVLFYATSNLRHLMPESQQDTLHTNDSIHEMLALSDRFALQIGFYDNGAQEYLHTLAHILQQEYNINEKESNIIVEKIRQDSLNFATKLGNRNPRTAKSYQILHDSRIKELLASLYAPQNPHNNAQ